MEKLKKKFEKIEVENLISITKSYSFKDQSYYKYLYI